MNWTVSTAHDLEAFDQNSDNANDKRLIAWVKLQLIADDVEAWRHMLARSTQAPVNRHSIQTFESRLTEWRDAAHPVINGRLAVTLIE